MPSLNSRKSRVSSRVLALVTDEWQDVEAIMEKAIPLVPPGKALRAYQLIENRNAADRAERAAAGQKTISTHPRPTETERIRRGARTVVKNILNSARVRQGVEIRVGETRMVRLDPARRWRHHCCLHGGSCAATDDTEDQ